MKKVSRTRWLAVVAVSVSAFLLIPSLHVRAAGPWLESTAGGPAACQAAQQDLETVLGLAMSVCPEAPSLPGVSPSSSHAPLVGSSSCLPTAYDRCEAWVSAPYDGAAKGIDRVGNMWSSGNSMAITPDGTIVFTAGDTDRVGPNYSLGPIAVVAIDAATGNRLWSARYEGPADRPFATVQSVVAHHGAVFVTGYTRAAGGVGVGMTLAYDALTGSPRWQADFPGVALASAISHDGALVFVVGEQWVDDGDGGLQAVATTVAYDTVTGQPVWSRSLTDRDSMPLVGWRTVTAPGRVTVLAGRVGGDGSVDGLVVATYAEVETDPEEPWELISRIAVPVIPGNLPAGLTVNADGSRAFVVQDRHGSPQSAFTAGFDTVAGTMLWTATYTGEGVGSYAVPWFFHPIDLSPSGEAVYVATLVESHLTDTEDIATVAYRAGNGEQLWSSIEHRVSPIRCVASCGPSLSVNPKTGQVVVAGASLVGNRQKAATWSYAPDGTLQWFRMASALPAGASVPVGQATESAWTSIVHGPSGNRVYVGGSTWAIFNDPDSSEDAIVAAFDTA